MFFAVIVAVGAVALVVVGIRLLRRSNDERRSVLEQRLGQRLSLVTLQGRAVRSEMTGPVTAVRRRDVVLTWKGNDVSIPLASIQEVWRGDSRLGHW